MNAKQKRKQKLLKKTKRFFVILLALTAIFILQNRIRNSNKPIANTNYTNSTYITQTLSQQNENCKNCLIPTEWYSNKGFMTPIVAGIIDGAWQEGVAITEIIKFVEKYAISLNYRKKINADAQSLYNNRDKLPTEISKELKKYSKELAGNSGADRAEYLFGKFLFNITTIVFSAGELAGLQPIKISSKFLKLQKLTKLEIECKACFKLLKQSGSLRNKIKDLPITKKLLHNDWTIAQKQGKTWDVFIKNYQAHHVIPVNLLHVSPELQFYYKNGGKFDFNSIENGIMVKKVNVGGVHAKHNKYNDYIAYEIEKMYKGIKKDDLPVNIQIKVFEKQLEQLIKETKINIVEKSINQNIKINNLY